MSGKRTRSEEIAEHRLCCPVKNGVLGRLDQKCFVVEAHEDSKEPVTCALIYFDTSQLGLFLQSLLFR